MRIVTWVGGAAAVVMLWISLAGPALGTTAAASPTNPLAVAKSLAISAGDVPSGWTSDDQAGQCIAGAGSDPSKPYCGNTPLPSEQAADDHFAKCLGVPVSHISMLTGADEPGEPFSYASSTYTAPGGPKANPDYLPQVGSFVTVEPSRAAQVADLRAFSTTSFPRCFEIEEHGPLEAVIADFAALIHGKLSFGTVHDIAVASRPGVSAVGYAFPMTLSSPKLSGTITYSLVILGAGHIESVIHLQSWSSTPFPPKVAVAVTLRIEGKLGAFGGGS
ncbi:MAG TPA: hypothetical protein VMS00_00570 [Acidimicrobiales bacterium]|nr:hypothetical protein [Acidimicrobiales bacterium]